MDARRLIKFGKNSFVISLPSQWTKSNKLSKGSSVFVTQSTEHLVISTRKRNSFSSDIVIDTTDKTLLQIKTEIYSAYLRSFKTIKFNGNNLGKYILDIKDIIFNLAGLEIIEDSDDKMSCKDLIDVREVCLQDTLKNIDFSIRGITDECIMYESLETYQKIFQKQQDINRLTSLCKRIIHRAIDDEEIMINIDCSVPQLLSYIEISDFFVQTAYLTCEMANLYTQKKLKGDTVKSFKGLHNEFKEIYVRIINSYYDRDIETAFSQLSLISDSMERIKRVHNRCKKSLSVHILCVLKQMFKDLYSFNEKITYSLNHAA